MKIKAWLTLLFALGGLLVVLGSVSGAGLAEQGNSASSTTAAVTVTGVSPQSNSHDAALDASLAITLSGAIQNSSVSTRTVFVHGGFLGQMDGTISFGSIQYNPSDDFFPGEVVQTSVTGGVLDSGGSPIEPYVWQFRAASGVASGQFASRDSFGGGDSRSAALGDVDGDGDLDALIANYDDQAQEVWLNNGSGNYGPSAHDTFGGGNSSSAALGDVDGDGDLDALIANSGQAQEVWLNDGSGDFGTAAHDSFGGGNSTSAALGDVDGDGDLDTLIANAGAAAQEVWLNDGSGNFGTAAHNSFGGGNSYSAALGDVDGDGDLDTLIANSGQVQEVWLNDGSGDFGAAAHDSFGGGNSTSVALGDLDGEGDLDALIANYGQAQEVWLNDGSGGFGTAAHDSFGGGFSYSVVLGDVDGDGDLDALITNGSNQAQEVWLNDGSGNFGTAAHDSFGAGDSLSTALGDVDRDGDLDAVTANYYGQAQEVWQNHAPEIDVQGNGVSISNGSTTPSTADDTDFGSIAADGGAAVHAFTISNTGSADLKLTATPNVTLTSGTHFGVSAQPGSSTITPGNATTFQVTFDPTMVGGFTDTVTIANNDADENPYTFVISGTGTTVDEPYWIHLPIVLKGSGH